RGCAGWGGRMSFFTYLLASAPYGTLYCGHTDDLAGRVWKHREEVFSGFTAKYGVKRLVWCEPHGERSAAFLRERQIKKWNRAWKVRIIEEMNPTWADLYDELVGWADPNGPLAGFQFTEPPSPPPLIPAKAGTQAEGGMRQMSLCKPTGRLGPRLRGDERGFCCGSR
ncbi:MAG TPA: GIY-YIG nuclease family protein, partial [Phenylobacterium sp.]|nr:GIY-YIG nuclease family protein [Phenylobacterium sp.]